MITGLVSGSPSNAKIAPRAGLTPSANDSSRTFQAGHGIPLPIFGRRATAGFWNTSKPTREKLCEKGLDNGPHTIAWHLQHHHQLTVSPATISRHLSRAG